MIIYDLVVKLLKTKPETRNSDKELMVAALRYLGAVKTVNWFGDREAVLLESLLSGSLPSFESIRRSRQKAQEQHPELEATNSVVRLKRKQKQKTKGSFIFRESV